MKENTLEARQLETIADSVIAFLCDESDNGMKRVQEAVHRAGNGYTQRRNHWLVNWIPGSPLRLFRHRNKPLDGLEQNMDSLARQFTEIDGRLQKSEIILQRLQRLAIVLLDPQGGWKSTSLNTYLLVYFMGLIDHCEHPTQEEFYYALIKKLNPIFKAKLQQSLQAYQFSVNKAKEEQAQVERLDSSKTKASLDFIYLTDQETRAFSKAKEEPKLAVFCLEQQAGQWQLKWVDLFGEAHPLAINSFLLQQLNGGKKSDTDEVKQACLKARDLYLSQNKILVNPHVSRLADLKSTFVVKHLPALTALDWYDDFGRCHQIDLEKYPDLLAYLRGREALAEKDLPALHHFLRQVDKLQQVGVQGARLKLEAFFKTNAEVVASTFQLLVNPKASDLGHLESTFVLNTKDDAPELLWYDAFGNPRQLDLAAMPSITTWIESHVQYQEQDLAELKILLAAVDRSQSLKLDAFKAELAACLERRRPAVEPSSEDKTPSGRLPKDRIEAFANLFAAVKAKTMEPAPSEKLEPPKLSARIFEFDRLFAQVRRTQDPSAAANNLP